MRIRNRLRRSTVAAKIMVDLATNKEFLEFLYKQRGFDLDPIIIIDHCAKVAVLYSHALMKHLYKEDRSIDTETEPKP